MEWILFLKLMKSRGNVYFDIWFDVLKTLEEKNEYCFRSDYKQKYSKKYIKSVINYGIEVSKSVLKNTGLEYNYGSVFFVEVFRKQIKKEQNIQKSKAVKSDTTDVYEEIISYLNEKTNSDYKPTTKTYIKLIDLRAKLGHTIQDFVTVIDKKSEEWMGTDFEKFLRPETLFGNKFETYLNQKTLLKNNSQQKAYEQLSKATELGWNTDKII